MADARSKNTMERFEKVTKLCHYVTEALIAMDDFEDELTPEIMTDMAALSARLRNVKDAMSKDIHKKMSAAGPEPIKAKAPPVFRPLTYAGPAVDSTETDRTWQLDEDWKAAEATGGALTFESKLLEGKSNH